MHQSLIQKYYSGNCSKEEKLRILKYLRENPDVVDRYFTEDSWEDFVRNNTENEEKDKFVRKAPDILALIYKRRKHKLQIVAAGIAACIAFVFFAILYQKQRHEELPIVQREYVPMQQNPSLLCNNSDKPVHFSLPDGSKVVLHAKTEVRYYFDSTVRTVYLSGEAIFDVFKDKRRPFKVISNGVATTALGTRFKVTAVPGKENVSVALYEGKVLVNVDSKKDMFYLQPGTALTFERESNDVFFTHIPLEASESNPIAVEKSSPPAQTGKVASVEFVNEPLEKIFGYLAKTHGVYVVDSTGGRLSKIGFVGTIKNTESLYQILSTIGSINGSTLSFDSLKKVYVFK